MDTRREFIKGTVLTSIAALSISSCKSEDLTPKSKVEKLTNKSGLPIVISTWEHGLDANASAWKVLDKGGKAIDAVEQGVRVSESDPDVTSVGYGGLPDRNGKVTLDACIMDESGNCGAVAAIEHIKNPISVARLVMEDTPHVLIVGEGALDFALEKGFKMEELLTSKAKSQWQKWIEKGIYNPNNDLDHDTIGMIAVDKNGDVSGACTTSGLSFKLHGRVGDSPIIGAGMFVDNEVGGAAATGVGEVVMKTLGTFLIVEQMRMGKSPQEACQIAVDRIAKKVANYKDMQVGYIAVNKNGETGAYSIREGFEYAVFQEGNNTLIKAGHLL